ncbi:unnamed protein product [Trichobilharzia regenti]|nr:unnamed protein product [Trichobilharzia regenti]
MDTSLDTVFINEYGKCGAHRRVPLFESDRALPKTYGRLHKTLKALNDPKRFT